MKKFALLGKNIAYSLSPELHKGIMKDMGLAGSYDIIDIEEKDIPEVLNEIRSGHLDGINVTIPYKVKIMEFLDEISPEAEAIGAVNCVVNRKGRLTGHNTDYYGVMGSFKKMELNLRDKKVYVLGTGGAAKSAVKALKDSAAHITIVTRNIERDAKLFPCMRMVTYEDMEKIKPEGYLIINCTPLGGMNSLESSPVSEEAVKKFEYVIDMVYKPSVTKFLSFAKEKEKSLNGMTMLTAQALKAQKLWKEF